MSSWSPETWIEFAGLVIAALTFLGSAAWGVMRAVRWLRNLKPRLKAELMVHVLTEPTTGRAIGNGIAVRLVHRGGRPVKIGHVYLRIRGLDLSTSFNAGWTGGLGAMPPCDVPKAEVWTGVRLYRMKENLLVRPEQDPVTEFRNGHEEAYFTAAPIHPNELNQWFLRSHSEAVELAAAGPDDDLVVMRGLSLQALLKGITENHPGPPINDGFPFRYTAHTVSRTPPNLAAIGTFNDRGFNLPAPPPPGPGD